MGHRSKYAYALQPNPNKKIFCRYQRYVEAQGLDEPQLMGGENGEVVTFAFFPLKFVREAFPDSECDLGAWGAGTNAILGEKSNQQSFSWSCRAHITIQ